MTQQTAPAIARTDLDWLGIVHRALQSAPTNDMLWVECVRSMRRLITVMNLASRDENHAAHAQYLLNKLVAHAVSPAAGATASGRSVPEVAEAIKDQLMHLAAGGRDDRALLL